MFQHLTYEGAVDIDKITDPVEKKATIEIINNFGQTPKQLFKKPHPQRRVTTTVQSNWFCKSVVKDSRVVAAAVPIKEVPSPVGQVCDVIAPE